MSRYLHPCQHWAAVDLVVSDGGEAGEVGGQHLGHRLEGKNGVSLSFPSRMESLVSNRGTSHLGRVLQRVQSWQLAEL